MMMPMMTLAASSASTHDATNDSHEGCVEIEAAAPLPPPSDMTKS
jgi:hypothetical protein